MIDKVRRLTAEGRKLLTSAGGIKFAIVINAVLAIISLVCAIVTGSLPYLLIAAVWTYLAAYTGPRHLAHKREEEHKGEANAEHPADSEEGIS